MSTFDFKAARERLCRQDRERDHALDARFQRAQDDFQRILDMAISEYAPERIYQWGSLLDRNLFTEMSDIDMAMEGLRHAEDIFGLAARADAISSLPVDIVEMERIEPEFAELIRRKGRVVYERHGGGTTPS